MKLFLHHERATEYAIPGKMKCDDGWTCFTQEQGRPLRAGTYDVVMVASAKFNTLLPAFRTTQGLIVGFIHPGNTSQRAPDHIIVGLDRAVDLIVDTKRAFDQLVTKINEADAMFAESVTCEVCPWEMPK